jgi:ATP-dependent DNA ligase
MKYKHRRSESLVVTGWLPASGKRGESLLLARVGADGSATPVGSVALGYSGQLREEIQKALRGSELPPVRPRQRVRRVAPRVRVRVDFHGPASGPLRDPVLREVVGTS